MHSFLVMSTVVLIGVWGGIWLAENSSVNEKVNALVSGLGGSGKTPSDSQSASEQTRAATPEAAGGKSQEESGASDGRLEFSAIAGIRYSCQPDSTRLEIEMGKSDLSRAGYLHNPERIYFDFQNSGWAKRVEPRLEKRKIDKTIDTVLAGIRLAPHGADQVRVVLDLKRACEYSYKEALEPSRRLIVEVRTHAVQVSARK